METFIELYTHEEWHQWLKLNYKIEKEVWLVNYNKSSGKQKMTYDEAVCEAVCWGWIDSTVRRINQEKFAQKYCIRKKKSGWSESNIIRAEKMISEERMSDFGLEVYRNGIPIKQNEDSSDKQNIFNFSTELEDLFTEYPEAKLKFEAFIPSYKKMCLNWINSAKLHETRLRRAFEVTKTTLENKKIGLK